MMNTQRTRSNLVSEATGIAKADVDRLLSNHQPLFAEAIRSIEAHRRLPTGSLAHVSGLSLAEIWTDALRYAELELTDADATIVAPFVTALGGFLLAAEAIKAGDERYRRWRLGPDGLTSNMRSVH